MFVKADGCGHAKLAPPGLRGLVGWITVRIPRGGLDLEGSEDVEPKGTQTFFATYKPTELGKFQESKLI